MTRDQLVESLRRIASGEMRASACGSVWVRRASTIGGAIEISDAAALMLCDDSPTHLAATAATLGPQEPLGADFDAVWENHAADLYES